MISLSGYLKKIRFLSSTILAFIALISLLHVPAYTFAASPQIISNATYIIDEDGDLSGSILYTVQADNGNEVLRFFTATVPFVDLSSIYVERNSNELEHSSHNQQYATDIVIDLDNLSIASGRTASFTISFVAEEFYNKDGVISIPLQIPQTDVNGITVKTPQAYGQMTVPSADNITLSQDDDYRSVKIKSPHASELQILFGETISYQFTISKTLTNDSSEAIIKDIIIPHSSNSREVIFNQIDPQPGAASIDQDNNMTLSYVVDADSESKITISGHIIMPNSDPENIAGESRYLSLNDYWRLDDGQIQQFANDALGGKEPDSTNSLSANEISLIYDYVVSTYTVSDEATTTRARASRAFDSKSISSADMNDILIALLRAYSVPSREVIGYVKSEAGNFSEDFVHTWVEYYDADNGWSLMDPTLEQITDISYNLSNSYYHIPFIYRTQDPVSPKLTTFEDGEFTATLDNEPSVRTLKAEISIEKAEEYSYLDNVYLTITINNNGNVPITTLATELGTEKISILPEGSLVMPGQEITTQILIDKNMMREDVEFTINDIYGNSDEIISSVTVHDSTPWWWAPFTNATSFLLFTVVISVIYFIIKLFRKGFKK